MKTFYHGTSRVNAESILREGIKPGAGKGADAWALHFNPMLGHALVDNSKDDRRHSVFVAGNKTIALWYADMSAAINGSDAVLVAVRFPADMLHNLVPDEAGLPDGSFGYRYEGDIPAAWCSMMDGKAIARVRHQPLPDASPLDFLLGRSF